MFGCVVIPRDVIIIQKCKKSVAIPLKPFLIFFRSLTFINLYKGRSKSVTVGGAVEKCDILLNRKDVYGSGVMGTSEAQGTG
jgi:hypothetical protein